MSVSIELVPKENIERIWPLIEEWVKNAVANDKSFSVDDIREQCVAGRIDLHCIYKNKLTGFIISCVYDAPRCRRCDGLWFGGENLADWSPDFFEQFKEILRDRACKQFSFMGRTAWKSIINADSEQSYYLFNL